MSLTETALVERLSPYANFRLQGSKKVVQETDWESILGQQGVLTHPHDLHDVCLTFHAEAITLGYDDQVPITHGAPALELCDHLPAHLVDVLARNVEADGINTAIEGDFSARIGGACNRIDGSEQGSRSSIASSG